jgi:flagellin-like hook-associated protein FlgL
MSVSGIGSSSSLLVASLTSMRSQLDDLQRQLGTGAVSTNYAGLGAGRGLVVGLGAQLSAISSYTDATTNVNLRINLQSAALTRIGTINGDVKAATQNNYSIDASGQTVGQQSSAAEFDEILNSLNTQAGDRYLFSGRATNMPAAQSSDVVLNGDVQRAGFKQVMSERNQADLGANGLGRLVLPPAAAVAATLAGTGATLSPDAPAVATGSQNLSNPYVSAGGTLAINGTNVTINPGDDVTAVLAAINAPGVVAATGVTATAPGGILTLTSANADSSIDLTGSTASLIGEFGIATGPTAPTNLLTQGAATAGQQLTVTVGANPPLTITFGTNQAAVPPEVSTLAELNSALGTLVGGTASVNPANGNITVTAANTTDPIQIGGTATPATFGLATTSAGPTNPIVLSEDTPAATASPFGFKLAAISTTVTGATVTGPAGLTKAVSVNFPQQPTAGQTVSIGFQLPDGTSTTLALTATTSTTPGPNEFTIGANLAATTANFKTTLNTSLSTLAATSLTAASSMAAANDFFDIGAGTPPMRVAGPPFNTATALVAGTPANTVSWYTGEMGTDSARSTAVAKVDDALSVAYGARGNEQAIVTTLKNTAVFVATTYSATDPNAQARYKEINQRVYSGLAGTNGQQSLQDIEGELAFAQSTMKDASTRNASRQVSLQDMLQGIEQADPQKIATEVLALQTQLQASLQTTAMLAKLSIVNYITA